MRFPLKLNRRTWPRWLTRWLPSIDDPGRLLASPKEHIFTQSVSTIKLGNTWKTTTSRRHQRSDAIIIELYHKDTPVILDIGASDGTSSLELMEKLQYRFAHYFVSDVFVSLEVRQEGKNSYFYHPESKRLFMKATPLFVVYDETEGALWPFTWCAEAILRDSPAYKRDSVIEIVLCQPRLQQMAQHDTRITMCCYNVLESWSGPAPDLIKVANVLNRCYFTVEEITRALTNIWVALAKDGRVVIVDNREREKVSVFRKARYGFLPEVCIDGGTEISDIVHQMRY